MKKKIGSGFAKVSALCFAACCMMAVMAQGAFAAIDVDKLTEPVQDEVDANLPKILLFIGGLIAISFVIGFFIKLLSKGKRG